MFNNKKKKSKKWLIYISYSYQVYAIRLACYRSCAVTSRVDRVHLVWYLRIATSVWAIRFPWWKLVSLRARLPTVHIDREMFFSIIAVFFFNRLQKPTWESKSWHFCVISSFCSLTRFNSTCSRLSWFVDSSCVSLDICRSCMAVIIMCCSSIFISMMFFMNSLFDSQLTATPKTNCKSLLNSIVSSNMLFNTGMSNLLSGWLST